MAIKMLFNELKIQSSVGYIRGPLAGASHAPILTQRTIGSPSGWPRSRVEATPRQPCVRVSPRQSHSLSFAQATSTTRPKKFKLSKFK